MHSCLLKKIATLITVVGGINWGLVGLFNYNVVAMLLGDMSTPARAVYGLVGLSALYVGFVCLTCSKKE
ncbi:MAG TPA: DUF378 domain-containing protein [Holosporales bacterium]|nr:DUF378 domain-containing protein [Holosporales bacterium]